MFVDADMCTAVMCRNTIWYVLNFVGFSFFQSVHTVCFSNLQQEPDTVEQGFHLLVSAAKCKAEVQKNCRQEGGEGRRLIHAAMISSSHSSCVTVTCR